MIKLIELIKKAVKGDNESFDTLMQSRKDNIYKVAYSYINNTEDALDIMQEVIYKALVSIKHLKEPQYFNTWLTRITINEQIWSKIMQVILLVYSFLMFFVIKWNIFNLLKNSVIMFLECNYR
ncbi:sigma factor [Clostridium tagluense]|uniref:sigma factor n=1 Tax=Clostridium tagluense TaxID=360422 RepID=UPI002714E3E9|nr:sigma factor [Clostridium tagluense]